MSGDTQPKKRKDKKRKKDDEDTVKETTVHAPKQASAGAAQAAKEPGDVQMHVHSDHGTGGHWCAKVVFFILLAGLGALIGLIIMENRGLSNEDTPLSESRYSEFFNGWVDENRQDDHHHDDILAAINSLDDHDDEEAHHAVGDHDEDDAHDDNDDDHDGGADDDHDDGTPYAEEEDHDDDEDGTDVQDDDEDEGPAQKLDDDEVEEIFTQQEAAAQQEAAVAADEDDDDDDDGDGQEDGDDDDDDDDGVAEPATNSKNAQDVNARDTADVDDDDQDDTPFDEEDDGDQDEIEEVKRGSQTATEDDDDDDNDDDDDKDDFSELVDNDGGEEEYLEKVRSEQERRAAAEEERRAATEPEEETSLTVKIFVGVALLGAAHLLLTSPRAPTKKPTPDTETKPRSDNTPSAESSLAARKVELEETSAVREPVASKPVLADFVNAGPTEDPFSSSVAVSEGNEHTFDDNYDAERYSGDDYEYELEELEEEAEEEEEAEHEMDEKNLIKQEQEIGAFVPITFEDFNSMYRAPPDQDEPSSTLEQPPVLQPSIQSNETNERPQVAVKKLQPKDSLLARKKPPKGAVNKLIYGLHKDPIVIPTEDTDPAPKLQQQSEHVSAPKAAAKTVLTALLSEIPSPPIEPHDGERTAVLPVPVVPASGKEKHVEFLLPDELEAEFELEPSSPPPGVDNGSKENLFVPDTSEEEADGYGEQYDEYAEEEEIVYEDELVEEEEEEDIESVLLNQYGSDEEEEPLTDDNIPPGGSDEASSDVDDSDLMRRLEEKYGKLPASASTSAAGTTGTDPDGNDDNDDDDATAAGWTKIPSRAEEADRSYQEELRRAEQQLDEEFGFE